MESHDNFSLRRQVDDEIDSNYSYGSADDDPILTATITFDVTVDPNGQVISTSEGQIIAEGIQRNVDGRTINLLDHNTLPLSQLHSDQPTSSRIHADSLTSINSGRKEEVTQDSLDEDTDSDESVSTTTDSLMERTKKYMDQEAGVIILKRTNQTPKNFNINLDFDVDNSDIKSGSVLNNVEGKNFNINLDFENSNKDLKDPTQAWVDIDLMITSSATNSKVEEKISNETFEEIKSVLKDRMPNDMQYWRSLNPSNERQFDTNQIENDATRESLNRSDSAHRDQGYHYINNNLNSNQYRQMDSNSNLENDRARMELIDRLVQKASNKPSSVEKDTYYRNQIPKATNFSLEDCIEKALNEKQSFNQSTHGDIPALRTFETIDFDALTKGFEPEEIKEGKLVLYITENQLLQLLKQRAIVVPNKSSLNDLSAKGFSLVDQKIGNKLNGRKGPSQVELIVNQEDQSPTGLPKISESNEERTSSNISQKLVDPLPKDKVTYSNGNKSNPTESNRIEDSYEQYFTRPQTVPGYPTQSNQSNILYEDTFQHINTVNDDSRRNSNLGHIKPGSTSAADVVINSQGYPNSSSTRPRPNSVLNNGLEGSVYLGNTLPNEANNGSVYTTNTVPNDYKNDVNPSIYNTNINPNDYNNGVNPSVYNSNTLPSDYNNGLNPSVYNTNNLPSDYNNGVNPSVYNTNNLPSDYNNGVKPSVYNTNTLPSGYNNGVNPSIYNTNINPNDYNNGVNPSVYNTNTLPSDYNNGVNPSVYNTNNLPSDYNNGVNPSVYNTNNLPSDYNNGVNPSVYNTNINPNDYKNGVNGSVYSTNIQPNDGLNRPLYPDSVNSNEINRVLETASKVINNDTPYTTTSILPNDNIFTKASSYSNLPNASIDYYTQNVLPSSTVNDLENIALNELEKFANKLTQSTRDDKIDWSKVQDNFQKPEDLNKGQITKSYLDSKIEEEKTKSYQLEQLGDFPTRRQSLEMKKNYETVGNLLDRALSRRESAAQRSDQESATETINLIKDVVSQIKNNLNTKGIENFKTGHKIIIKTTRKLPPRIVSQSVSNVANCNGRASTSKLSKKKGSQTFLDQKYSSKTRIYELGAEKTSKTKINSASSTEVFNSKQAVDYSIQAYDPIVDASLGKSSIDKVNKYLTVVNTGVKNTDLIQIHPLLNSKTEVTSKSTSEKVSTTPTVKETIVIDSNNYLEEVSKHFGGLKVTDFPMYVQGLEIKQSKDSKLKSSSGIRKSNSVVRQTVTNSNIQFVKVKNAASATQSTTIKAQ